MHEMARTEKGTNVEEHFRANIMPFRKTFCNSVHIKFLGLFDPIIGPLRVSSFLASPARIIRHAVAIDERRAEFRPQLISMCRKGGHSGIAQVQDCEEVWFAGCHTVNIMPMSY